MKKLILLLFFFSIIINGQKASSVNYLLIGSEGRTDFITKNGEDELNAFSKSLSFSLNERPKMVEIVKISEYEKKSLYQVFNTYYNMLDSNDFLIILMVGAWKLNPLYTELTEYIADHSDVITVDYILNFMQLLKTKNVLFFSIAPPVNEFRLERERLTSPSLIEGGKFIIKVSNSKFSLSKTASYFNDAIGEMEESRLTDTNKDNFITLNEWLNMLVVQGKKEEINFDFFSIKNSDAYTLSQINEK
jgi:hypothetical protein